jgi:hypothetical protein
LCGAGSGIVVNYRSGTVSVLATDLFPQASVNFLATPMTMRDRGIASACTWVAEFVVEVAERRGTTRSADDNRSDHHADPNVVVGLVIRRRRPCVGRCPGSRATL